MRIDVEYYINIISKHLTVKRYNHSVSVYKESVRLAKRYGADENRAAIAGVLHDITKDIPHDFQLSYCHDRGITLSVHDLASPKLLHAITGASFIERVLNIGDSGIIAAVRCHTTGRAGMALLDKVLYLADCIEPLRDYEGVGYIREAAYDDIDEAMRRAIEVSISEVRGKGAQPHPDTMAAWESFGAEP